MHLLDSRVLNEFEADYLCRNAIIAITAQM